MKRRGVFWVLLVLGGFVVSGAEGAELLDGSLPGKVEGTVLQEMAATGQSDFFIWLTEKADLSPASKLKTKREKGRFVFETLRSTAERTQKEIRAYLDSQGIRYKPFYIANKILVRGGNIQLLSNLASLPNVAKVTANRTYQLPEPIISPTPPSHVLGVESNINFIDAPFVWSIGATGQGIVLAGNDTGLDKTHPAIAPRYRGCLDPPACSLWDHNHNWWDATGTYPTNPYDGHNHGTFTTGTMVGDDGAGNQIGVAPGAQTIHCKNMTDGGSGTDATFTECFEWDLAPWNLSGYDPRPDLAPDAVNNSWGYWGGSAPQFEDEIQALQAAGIVVVVAAGNEGSACSTLRSPGDYEQVLTVGAVDHSGGTPPGTIASFSSRGPSGLYPSAYFPDVMAPGVNIRSSVVGGGYSGGWSGTSMAAPHVTGLVALLWSFAPGLRGQVEETMDLIQGGTIPLTGQAGSSCGGDYTQGPNNDWGYGTINSFYAFFLSWLVGGYMEASPSEFDVTLGPNQVVDRVLTLSYDSGGSPGSFSVSEVYGGSTLAPSPPLGEVASWRSQAFEPFFSTPVEVGPLSVQSAEGRAVFSSNLGEPLASLLVCCLAVAFRRRSRPLCPHPMPRPAEQLLRDFWSKREL